MNLGFIGQGWIGKNYSDDFERRGFEIVRYSLEEPYNKNKAKIKSCDLVFVAVPTPTTQDGFDLSIVKNVIKNINKGATVVIKSTLLPGSTEELQRENPDLFIFHSPEFLTEANAAYDAANPQRNIIGMPINNKEYRTKAKEIIKVLPKAPYELICFSREAELVKYAGNCFLYAKVMFINLLYDLSQKLDCDWQNIRNAMVADKRIGLSHMDPLHKTGRGAGGHCFIKDFAAFREIYQKLVKDELGVDILKAMENKNVSLLLNSKKDLDLLLGVYGDGKLKGQIKASDSSAVSMS